MSFKISRLEFPRNLSPPLECLYPHLHTAYISEPLDKVTLVTIYLSLVEQLNLSSSSLKVLTVMKLAVILYYRKNKLTECLDLKQCTLYKKALIVINGINSMFYIFCYSNQMEA